MNPSSIFPIDNRCLLQVNSIFSNNDSSSIFPIDNKCLLPVNSSSSQPNKTTAIPPPRLISIKSSNLSLNSVLVLIKNNDIEKIKRVITKNNIHEFTFNYCQNILMCALHNNKLEIILYLIEIGINFDVLRDIYGTMFHISQEKTHEIMDLLTKVNILMNDFAGKINENLVQMDNKFKSLNDYNTLCINKKMDQIKKMVKPSEEIAEIRKIINSLKEENIKLKEEIKKLKKKRTYSSDKELSSCDEEEIEHKIAKFDHDLIKKFT